MLAFRNASNKLGKDPFGLKSGFVRLDELREHLSSGSPVGEGAPYAVIRTADMSPGDQEQAVEEAARWLDWGAGIRVVVEDGMFTLKSPGGDYRLPLTDEGGEALVVVPRYSSEVAERIVVRRPLGKRTRPPGRRACEFVRFTMPGCIADRHEIITALLHARAGSDWPESTRVETSTGHDGKTTYYLVHGDAEADVGVLHEESQIYLMFLSHRSALAMFALGR